MNKAARAKMREKAAKRAELTEVVRLADAKARQIAASALLDADARTDARIATAAQAGEAAVEEVRALRDYARMMESWAEERSRDLAGIAEACGQVAAATQALVAIAERALFGPPVAPPPFAPSSVGAIDALLAEKAALRNLVQESIERAEEADRRLGEVSSERNQWALRATAGTAPPWLRREAARLAAVEKPLANLLQGAPPVVKDLYGLGLRCVLWAGGHDEDLPMPEALARADDQRAMLAGVARSLHELLRDQPLTDPEAVVHANAMGLRRLLTLVEVVLGAPAEKVEQ